MEQQASKIIKVLKSSKLRVTPQRFAVYANLLGRTDHPTAEQILQDLNQHSPISSQATVYSCLQALQEVGLVRQVLLEEGICRYDANVQPHHHFRCQTCGAIEDLAWDILQSPNLEKLRPGTRPQGYELTVYGICAECAH
ncbi:Fur family transcriptional regulator [Gloeocapsa sp. PCC 73106]|uniref:Fur family transcriptional regulator n=1 Tax=Gloeocapsa sp. PCC 73106 TaxID=102232 RepID=UPI0002ACD26A|nr:Fur family transcriptional regulator [Gloeocapsa sp. PCC 73106]ELR97949.1 Fe2+/Zn2+ uptake regulation protein [Gloeocapsa sp. PCC 73106]